MHAQHGSGVKTCVRKDKRLIFAQFLRVARPLFEFMKIPRLTSRDISSSSFLHTVQQAVVPTSTGTGTVHTNYYELFGFRESTIHNHLVSCCLLAKIVRYYHIHKANSNSLNKQAATTRIASHFSLLQSCGIGRRTSPVSSSPKTNKVHFSFKLPDKFEDSAPPDYHHPHHGKQDEEIIPTGLKEDDQAAFLTRGEVESMLIDVENKFINIFEP